MCSLSAQLPRSPFFKRSPECRNDSSVTSFLSNRDLLYVPFSFAAYSSDVLLCQFFYLLCNLILQSLEQTLHLIVLIEKVTVETGIKNPNQRVSCSDFSLYIITKIFVLSCITDSCKEIRMSMSL